jgi:hypothetical protein
MNNKNKPHHRHDDDDELCENEIKLLKSVTGLERELILIWFKIFMVKFNNTSCLFYFGFSSFI